jgi:hypothetical protein
LVTVKSSSHPLLLSQHNKLVTARFNNHLLQLLLQLNRSTTVKCNNHSLHQLSRFQTVKFNNHNKLLLQNKHQQSTRSATVRFKTNNPQLQLSTKSVMVKSKTKQTNPLLQFLHQSKVVHPVLPLDSVQQLPHSLPSSSFKYEKKNCSYIVL